MHVTIRFKHRFIWVVHGSTEMHLVKVREKSGKVYVFFNQFFLIAFVFHFQKQDKVNNVVVEQLSETSVKLSWPDLINSTINLSELLSDYVVFYNSTYKNNSCQEGSFVANIEVNHVLTCCRLLHGLQKLFTNFLN